MTLDLELLSSIEALGTTPGSFNATLRGHGLYDTFRFVLRLSPVVHRTISELPTGIVTASEVGLEGAQAFSTYLHETIHWWQHVGSTFGLMLSLSYPTQAHGNHKHLRQMLRDIGFKKPIRNLIDMLGGPGGVGTPAGLANIIVNNHFDFDAFRHLTFSRQAKRAIVRHELFESVGHAHHMTYANNIVVLGAMDDPRLQLLPNPKEWEAPFRTMREQKEPGFYYGSPIEVWPIGAREIFEGQARFAQIQYLAFYSDGRLGWDEFRRLGMLHGVYVDAFEAFLRGTGLEWPPGIDHPTVGLFLLICDMAINPGAGFPFSPHPHFPSFIHDTDPGTRFSCLCTAVRLKCPEAAHGIQTYSRGEYEQVTEALSRALYLHSPLAIARRCSEWSEAQLFTPLMDEYKTFDYQPTNLPVRMLFSHFLVFMKDKFLVPEFFCWPGAWMAGTDLSENAAVLFDRHRALFLDKEDDDGIFPRVYADRDLNTVHNTFEMFYAGNITYDLVDQWITRPGPFVCDYKWLSQSGTNDQMKTYADHQFAQLYEVHLDEVELV